jgi:hypothetical protein
VRGKKEKRGIRHFLEGEYSARTHQPSQGTQDGYGIGKELQDETAHSCVEWFVDNDLIHIGLSELNIVKAGLGNARSSTSDGIGIAFDAHYFSRSSNQFGSQHGDVADTGAEIQDTLAWTNACLAEKPFGERSEARSLPNKALAFRVGAAKSVVEGGIGGGHDWRGLYH